MLGHSTKQLDISSGSDNLLTDVPDTENIQSKKEGDFSISVEYNSDSYINRFTPSYTSIESNLGKDVVHDLVDLVLWVEGGEFDGSKTECSTVSALDGASTDYTFDNRLKYWQEYLKDQRKISKKIMKATGKERCDLLLNRNEEYRKIQQCKRIIDIAERLSPSRLINRQPLKLKEIPCRPDVYETLPYTEQHGKSNITFVDIPTICLQEQELEGCGWRKNSWLNSEYLGTRVTNTRHQLQHAIKDHYPNTSQLAVTGKQINPHMAKEHLTTEENDQKDFKFQVNGVWYKTKEKTHEFVISIDDEVFDAEDNHSSNLNYYFCFENDPFVKATKLMTIRIRGWQSVDLEWYQQKQRRPKCIRNTKPIYPAFYFNKNHKRMLPDTINIIEFTFCCKESGIYEEMWEMKLIPDFLDKKSKITIHLFGHCQVDPVVQKEFIDIENDLSERAARQVVNEVIYEMATFFTPDPIRMQPYSTNFTQGELFAVVNPTINYSEHCIEELQNIYNELKLEIDPQFKEWNFDIKQIKNLIMKIADEQKRKKYYAKYTGIVNSMKVKPIIFNPNYKDQMFLLVRGVLIAMAEKMDETIQRLEQNMKPTQYDLSFDEVLVTNSILRKGRPDEQGDETAFDREDTKSFCVLKSEFVKSRKDQAFQESLYIQMYGLLSLAVEEVASVIDGMKNLL